MKQTVMFVFISCAAALTALPAQAQEWPAEQLEVWETISKQWDLAKAEDDAWMDQLHPSFLGWVGEASTPHDKEVTRRFIAAEAGHFKTLVQHYYSMSLAQYTDDGEQETFDGQHTEVLTKTADGWQFLG